MRRAELSGARYATLAAAVLLTLAACDRHRGSAQPSPPPPPRAIADTPALDARLLGNLDSRQQWQSHGVKVWLANPTVAATLVTHEGRTTTVHAWNANENDYNTPMMRLDSGPVLYAITTAEFEELRRRAAAPAPAGGAD